ncbi:HDOD domain-containing protein [Caldimonas brevitalea]|uniref:Histidine kinase n=1 Tax=Caldimonas brevitalea TaxID=413882 RepID=A0A0G3BTS5_9BURK|nr:HDOD domain-containing protein [Caldimonas brevitalea]AKJ31438.1 histidine kinase [Caldimonas brevitalea]
MLLRALPDLAAWTAYFRDAEIPVLPSTVSTLEALRAAEDQVDAHTLAPLLGGDPLMSLKLLIHAARARPAHFSGSTETVTAALVFLGISPFFRAFDTLVSTEALLHEHPDALEGLAGVLRRAGRAATFSLGFAVHRMDTDAPVLHEAALIHDFAELLLWCHAPALAAQIRALQRQDPSLRSAAAQRQVLNVTLCELEQSLMRAWRLPEILIRVTDDAHADQPQVRNVMLAIRLARHTEQGWDNPAVPDDIAHIAALLHMSEAAAWELVRELDA